MTGRLKFGKLNCDSDTVVPLSKALYTNSRPLKQCTYSVKTERGIIIVYKSYGSDNNNVPFTVC